MGADIEQAAMAALQRLPPERQREALRFIEALDRRSAGRRRRSLRGAAADLDISLDDDELARLRLEMWRGFPHDDDRGAAGPSAR